MKAENGRILAIVFHLNLLFFNDIDSILVPSCLSRQDVSINVHGDLERLRSKFGLRSRSRGDPSRSYRI